VRFRVKNSVGWSGFSPVATFIAADYPSKPNPMTLIDVSAESISLEFDL